MSYGKYVLLTIEEHEDLISRQKAPEETVDKLLKAPLDNDSKVAHLRSHLTNIVKTRLDTQEEPEASEETPSVTENTIFTPTPPSPQQPPPRTRRSSLHDPQPTSDTTTAPLITPEIAKKRFLEHIGKFPNIFQLDKSTGKLTIFGNPITIHNIKRIADDLTNEAPLHGVQPSLALLSEELKKTDFPERFILNPRRKYRTRASPRSFSVTRWKS